MRRLNKIIIGVVCLASLMLSLSSCSEKSEVSEYDNWQARNEAFIDSIAQVCAKNADGTWTKICAYNLNDSVEAIVGNNQHYIYVQKLEKGTGESHPLFTDSIRVHYIGRLIPTASYKDGKVFDKSYSTTTFNELTDVPTLLSPSGLTTGFSTAVQNMVVGDRWRIYVPAYLGYGSSSSKSAIPAYSALFFELKLAKIYKYKIDTDMSWH